MIQHLIIPISYAVVAVAVLFITYKVGYWHGRVDEFNDET